MSQTASGTPWRRPAWLRAVRAVETTLTRTALGLAMAGVVLMAAFTCYQVFMRFVLGQPSTWSEVLVRSILVWTVYLAAAATFREGAAIAAEIVVRAMPRVIGKTMQIVSGALSLLFLYLLVKTSLELIDRTSSQILAGLEIRIFWVYLAMPVGGVLAALAVLVRTSELLEPGAAIHDPHTDSIA